MMIAGAFEGLRHHQPAKAIAREGRQFLDETPTPTAHDLQSLTGRGVQARIDGEVVRIGKAEMFGRDGIADLSTEMAAAIERLREQGRTTRVVRKGEDRKSVVSGKSVSVRVDLGGRRIIKTTKKK